jgi:hypothetical protein
METQQTRKRTPSATRRNVLLGMAAGVGVSAAMLSTVKAQEKSAPSASGPILFKRTAETERYYKTLK